jgi:hypothetical protein
MLYNIEIKDIGMFNPAFIRVKLASGGMIVFDYVDGDYRSRETGQLLSDVISKEEHYEYHISLKSADKERALLVFESDTDKEVITKLAGLVREKGLKFILKDSGNRSLHLCVPVICKSNDEFEKLFDNLYYLLDEKDRAKLDLNLRNLNVQVRGFESIHHKSYEKTRILSGRLDYLNKEFCVENRSKFGVYSDKQVNSVPGKVSFKPIESLGVEKQDKLISIAKTFKKGERSVSLVYVASKLADNENNKRFLNKLVNAVKDKTDYNPDVEYGACVKAIGKNYSKKHIQNTSNGRVIMRAIYSKDYGIGLIRGVKDDWDSYEKKISEIEDKETRKNKVDDFNKAKKFLNERDLLEFIPDARNGIQIAKSLELMETSAGLRISREEYRIDGVGDKPQGMIKNKLATNGLEELERMLTKGNKKNDFEFGGEIPEVCNKNFGEFALMNKGNKHFTPIYFDIETSASKQEPVLVGVYNRDCKRIVLAHIIKNISLTEEQIEQGITIVKPKFEKCYKNGIELIRCEVKNGYEALFLADAESYLACAINSLMRQGDITPSILKDYIPGIDINFDFVNSILNNKRRSLWIAHNSNFDINKLNLTDKNGLLHIKNNGGVAREEIKINYFGDKKVYNSYKWNVAHELGNVGVAVGFRAVTRKYGLWEKPEIELKPIQREADSYVYGIDSLLIAKALQKSKGSLKDLGEEFNTPVKKSDSSYSFTGNELWEKNEKDVKEIEYLIKDLLVTDYIFTELTRELEVVGDLLGVINIDKERIKKHRSDIPYVCKIYSTASLSKMFYQFKYAEDYDDWKVKENNMKFYNNINDLFKEVYSGGRVEIFRHGIINNAKIVYSDFASLYPHTSYLTNVEPLMVDILNKKLDFTAKVDDIAYSFWVMVYSIAKKIQNKEALVKSDFCNSAVLNVTLGCDLRLSRKAGIKGGQIDTDKEKRNRCDLIINKGSSVNVSIYDLCYGVLDKHLIDKVSLGDLEKQIVFNKGLMVNPLSVTNKQNDFHTLLYDTRNKYRKEAKELSKIPGNELRIKHLENQSQFMKIILNAGYGITAEFTNMKAGQFYNPILASSITGMARLLNNITEITTRYHGYKCYYSDTDSLMLDSGGFNIVNSLFKDICELKNELSDGVFITDMMIIGAKEYAYFTNDPKKYAVKTHGVGYRARGYEKPLEKLIRLLVSGVDKSKAIQEAVKETPILSSFNFTHVTKSTSTLYTNLASLVNKKNEPKGEYKLGESTFKVFDYGKTDLFITDCDKITKGTFGTMLRLSDPKIYLFSVKYGFNEEQAIEVLSNIPGIPKEKRFLILDNIARRSGEAKFLERYLGKNEDNVKRKILDNGETTPFSCSVSEDINVAFNKDVISLDGVEYVGVVEMPDFDFSSKMEADLSTYYSKAITSMSKNLSYWYARQNNPDTADEVFNKRNSDLLIPQKKNEILVPLNMIEVPKTDVEIRDMLQLKERKKLLEKYFVRDEVGKYQSLKKKVNPDLMRQECLTSLKPRNVIIEEMFNNKRYWFEVTSHKSNKHNAILRINVVVGNPPRLKVCLWVNPTPFFNVELWESTYTDLMFSAEGMEKVISEVFRIAFNNSPRATYNSITSSFSRGSSYSLSDLKNNSRYFLDICYTNACAFIVMNAIKKMSLKIGRTDVSANVKLKVNKSKEDLVTAMLQSQLGREVEVFLDTRFKDNISKFKARENIYTASGGHYSGLVNKSTKISQIIYNKNKQLDMKLIKSSRKKGYDVNMIRKLQENKNKSDGIWRLEVQAYGFEAIYKTITSYDRLMKKLTRTLKVCIDIINRIDEKEFEVMVELNTGIKDFSVWFNDRLRERCVKPPALQISG